MNMHPFTFKTFGSYLEIVRKPGASSIDLNFQMRTFEPNGILFYTNLSEPRQMMVGINDVPDQDFLRVRNLIKQKRIYWNIVLVVS
jgi:hypothetical protein